MKINTDTTHCDVKERNETEQTFTEQCPKINLKISIYILGTTIISKTQKLYLQQAQICSKPTVKILEHCGQVSLKFFLHFAILG